MSQRDHQQHRNSGKGGRGRQHQHQHGAPQRGEAEAQQASRQQHARADTTKRTPSDRGTPTSSSARSPHAARQRRSDEAAQNISACAPGAQAEQLDRQQQASSANYGMLTALGEPAAAYSNHTSACASRLPSPSSATAQSEVRSVSVNREAHVTSGKHAMRVREPDFRPPACLIA